jgi:LEA14-like dessication related protein
MIRPAVLVALASLAAGCEALQDFVPQVAFDRLEVDDLDFEAIDAGFVFRVDNPNPIAVRLDRFSYDLDLQQVDLLAGDEPEGLALPAGAAAEVRLPATLVWASVWELVDAVRGEDEVDFGLSGSFGFDSDIGPIDLPYNAGGRFPALRTPRIDLGRLRVGRVDVLRGTADVSLDVAVDNDHRSNLDLQAGRYTLRLAGRDVAEGVLPALGAVEGASTRTVSVPITVDLVRAGAGVVDLLTRGGRVDAGFDATLDVGTPFGVLPLTVDETGDIEVAR